MPTRAEALAALAAIDAALAVATDGQYRRKLLPAERFVDLSAIERNLEQGKQQIIAAVAPIQERQVAELLRVAQRYIDRGEPIDVDKLDVPFRGEMRDAIYDVILAQYQDGQRQVRAEVRRQRSSRDLIAEPIPEMPEGKILQLLRLRAGALVSVFSARIKASLATIVNLQMGPAYEAERARQSLLEAVRQDVVRNAAPTVADAFNTGRAQSAGEMGAEIAIFTSVLEESTCAACADNDGKEFVVGSPDYWANMPPYTKCDWPANCRCQFVFEVGEAYWRGR